MARYLIVVLGGVLGTWMAFDGARALVTGSYTTPASGPYAGQLGPWASLLSGLGINPLSVGISVLHVALGVAWMTLSPLLFRRRVGAWRALLLTAVLSLWYLPFGTLVGFVVAGLLMTPALRKSGR